MAGLDLGKQVGPLPFGGWIVVVAGGLGIGYLINRNMARNTASEEDSSTQLTESGVGGGGGPQFVYTPPSSGTGDTVPETNQSWGVKVKNWLIAQNHDPVVADNAVRKYLAGLALSTPEKGLISLALIQFGAPPDDIPVVDEPTPETPTGGVQLPAVVYLHVNRATRRNDVVWDDSSDENDQADFFMVVAKNLSNGKTIAANVPAIPGKQTYSWNHPAYPYTNTAYTYEYTVTPYDRGVAGTPAKVTAKHIM